jgi:hypothetical protein
VSDDHAYAESLFRTAKYRPEFPAKGFAYLVNPERDSVVSAHSKAEIERHLAA